MRGKGWAYGYCPSGAGCRPVSQQPAPSHAGAAGLAGMAIAGAHTPYAWLVLPMMAAGFGTALTMPAATASVMEAAPARLIR
jgi:MFS transporter, DHA2 family, methylenomycin A resistance protein